MIHADWNRPPQDLTVSKLIILIGQIKRHVTRREMLLNTKKDIDNEHLLRKDRTKLKELETELAKRPEEYAALKESRKEGKKNARRWYN